MRGPTLAAKDGMTEAETMGSVFRVECLINQSYFISDYLVSAPIRSPLI